ncbi:MAG: glycosyltransferase [Candidatus Paceibacterota bacterium]|jgi:colanic acid/amylovoran biosynthesis glycosyltransferase
MPEHKLKGKKILFLTGSFPVISETFIINQITDLLDSGINVEMFSFSPGDKRLVSDRFSDYQLFNRTTYLNFPKSKVLKLFKALPKIIKILLTKPILLFKIFNFKKYGQFSRSLKTLFWVEPFVGRHFDLVHCHFGTVANKFLLIKEILGIKSPLVVSFYGYDISHIIKEKGSHYYDRLIKETKIFIAMSENMKERLIKQGFPGDKIIVLPVSIDVGAYPFKVRKFKHYPINLISVGRFVEKKGFPDLLHAIRLVVDKVGKDKVKLHIIGDGPLKSEIFSLTDKLKLESVVKFYGYQKIEDIIKFFMSMDIYLQTSKIANDGDME